jgi:hypothetical protein
MSRAKLNKLLLSAGTWKRLYEDLGPYHPLRHEVLSLAIGEYPSKPPAWAIAECEKHFSYFEKYNASRIEALDLGELFDIVCWLKFDHASRSRLTQYPKEKASMRQLPMRRAFYEALIRMDKLDKNTPYKEFDQNLYSKLNREWNKEAEAAEADGFVCSERWPYPRSEKSSFHFAGLPETPRVERVCVEYTRHQFGADRKRPNRQGRIQTNQSRFIQMTI